ncbi:ATP-binding protein [Streptomyces malaysiensis]|uniref:ATP-binding protein n=1 Tax=Streptomyces malaysiensis TaxID=92644 RepID=UPI002B2F7940|nr:tetratricopeptide repeat protein [Streptomyces malaysiensis]
MAGDEHLGRQEGSTGSVSDRSWHGDEARSRLGQDPDPGLGRTRLELELESGYPADVVPELRSRLGLRPAAYSRPTAASRPQRPLAETAPVVRPAQLPAAVADFTGREHLVRELNERLAAPADRPAAIAIAGVGGIGKTALAVHLAHTARHRYPDGQLYIDLGGAGSSPADPETALGAFLRSLGTPDAAIPDGTEERAALYRASLEGRRVLVLLDNARDAAQVRPLLPGDGAPDCVALITSRAHMTGLDRTHPVDLDAMSPAEAFALFALIVGEERAAVERAEVMNVVASCSYLPLAIRIAACRLASRRTWTVSVLARKLADERRRLDELRAGDLAVKATFELGYGQLDPAQARAFRLLGLVGGPDISLPAAGAVLGLDVAETGRLLTSLVDISLLESAVPGRYRFHDLVRLYARACSERETRAPAEREEALSRLLDFYLATAARVYAMERPGDRMVDHLESTGHPGLLFETSKAALDWLFAEADCLLACVPRCTGECTRRRAGDLLLGALDLAESGARPRQYETVARAVGDAAHAAGDSRTEARARSALGHLYSFTGRYSHAERELRRALELDGEDPVVASRASNQLGIVTNGLGRYEDAERYLGQALEAFRADANEAGEASALANLSRLHVSRGRTRTGVELAEQGLAIYRRLGAPLRLANGMYTLGIALTRAHRLEEASVHLAEALGLFHDARQPLWEGMAHFRLAEIQLMANRPDQAVAHAQQSLALGGLGGEWRRFSFLTVLAKALMAAGQRVQAEDCWRQARALRERLGSPEPEEVRQLLSASTPDLPAAQDPFPGHRDAYGVGPPVTESDPWI